MSALPTETLPLVEHLSRQKGIECIGVFGSFATGHANEKSDVDLVIAGEGTFDRIEFLKWNSELCLLAERQIDLIDMATAHPPLLGEIFKTVIWHKKNPEILARHIYRNVLEVADFLPLRMFILKNRVRRFLGE